MLRGTRPDSAEDETTEGAEMTNPLHRQASDFYTFFVEGKEHQVEKTTDQRWTVFGPDSRVLGSYLTLSEVRTAHGLDG